MSFEIAMQGLSTAYLVAVFSNDLTELTLAPKTSSWHHPSGRELRFLPAQGKGFANPRKASQVTNRTLDLLDLF